MQKARIAWISGGGGAKFLTQIGVLPWQIIKFRLFFLEFLPQ